DSKETAPSVTSFVSPYADMAQKKWQAVFRPSEDIFSYSREQLLIDAMVDPADSSRFLISNQLVLLDSKHRIRGFYDISQKGEVGRLEDELKLISVEEIRNRSLKVEKK